MGRDRLIYDHSRHLTLKAQHPIARKFQPISRCSGLENNDFPERPGTVSGQGNRFAGSLAALLK